MLEGLTLPQLTTFTIYIIERAEGLSRALCRITFLPVTLFSGHVDVNSNTTQIRTSQLKYVL